MSTQNPNRGGGKRPSRSAKANTSGRQSSEGKGKKQFSKSFDNKGERNFRPKRRDGEQSGEYRPKQFS
ncbi:hypothetical protein, partial [Eisenibacter elegans]|uniref:hypothetical protein n=1 Tax=Eisenibacter elegans TaxID=997 RepID=UPI00055770B2